LPARDGDSYRLQVGHVIQDGPAHTSRVHHNRCARQCASHGADALDRLRVWRPKWKPFKVADVNVAGHRLGHSDCCWIAGLAKVNADDEARISDSRFSAI
jgi:hypothetical protein